MRGTVSQSGMDRERQKQAVIIKALLEGSSELDIEHQLGYRKATIDKALVNLSAHSMNDIWLKNRDTVFRNVDRSLVDNFIACGCNCRNYIQDLARKRGEVGVERSHIYEC